MHSQGRKDYAYLHDPIEIYNLLKNIQKSRQQIGMTVDTSSTQSLTSLINVDMQAKILLFDEPNPGLEIERNNFTKKCKFSFKFDQLPVEFNTTISRKQQNTSNELLAPFPDEIYYPQQRQYYRFKTEHIDEINTTIFFSSEIRLACKLINLSINGLKLQLPYGFARAVQPEQRLKDIYIELPDEKGFSVSAKVKNARRVNNYNDIEIGLEMLHAEPVIEKRIQQFIYRSDNL